jgi:hypothetical protein
MKYIPAKTFLLGEYLALKGGPSLIALTQPCFGIDEAKRLHPDCVAARFWQAKTKTLIPFGLSDPFQGKGEWVHQVLNFYLLIIDIMEILMI